MIPILFILFFTFSFLNVPIAFSLGLSSITALVVTGSFPIEILSMTMAQALDSFSYMAIPFFILAGTLMEKGGISKRLVTFASSLVGSIPGGLAIVCIISATFFGAISGSGPATVAAIGGIVVPYMVSEGYGKGFSVAVAAAAGCIGLFIPPSIAMITYGVASNQSIADLFVGGVGPGLLTSLGLCVVAYIISKRRGYKGTKPFELKEVIRTLKDAIWPLLMPVIILGGIYGGIFTPTESAAVACIYALVIGFFVTRELKLSALPDILAKSTETTAMIMLIIATSAIFGRLLTLEQLPAKLVNFIVENNVSTPVFLLLLNIVLLFVGTFMELNSTILIMTPILIPLAQSLGIDLVHIGVILVVNMTFGLLTPPLGVHLFVGCGLTDVSFEEVVKEIWPFLAVGITVIFLTTYVPQIPLWLVEVINK